MENHLAKQQKEKGDGEEGEEEEIPVWLEKYIRYKFDLYDRTGECLPEQRPTQIGSTNSYY